MTAQSQAVALLQDGVAKLHPAWLADLKAAAGSDKSRVSDSELNDQTREFLQLMAQASRNGLPDIDSEAGAPLRRFLETLSRSRAAQGATSSQTATFVFSLKRSIFAALRTALANDSRGLADETWAVSELLDRLGLFTVVSFQKSRESIIERQREEMLELSTPVVKLWDGVLALPMIGTLDSARTQVVMESLLQRIVETGASVAIIDITGVPTVDTLTAQHLLKTVTAARLMGADCIISGIRPQIAQTIVHLGVDLGAVTTKATLADAFRRALEMTGQRMNVTAPRA